jgi:GT2 family glycosyltransferase
MISIIIVTFNAFEYVKLCLESIRNSDLKNIRHEIIIIDNNSQEAGMREWLEEQTDVKLVLNNENLLLTAGQRQGLSIIVDDSRYVLFLNPDFEFTRKNWATIMLRKMHSQSNIAIVGQQMNRNKRTFETNIDMCHLMIRRDVLDEIGGFQDWFPEWNGVGYALCKIAQKSGYIYKECQKVGIHHKGKSRIFNPIENRKVKFDI